MSERESKINLYGRFILRILGCIAFGLAANIILAIVFFLWCIIFFGVLSYQTAQIFTFIFINLGYFTGTSLAGWLSNSLKRSIITTIPIAIILGTIFIIISGTLFGIINIFVISFSGFLGGYINEKNLFNNSD
ncbi:MAG: hypothetical protein GF329_09465 [Candidatus Lokiarchaeota archaeon]|nr:hypothetical protein [Candidatus Lokiarchaeota archaeon]